LQGSLQNLKIQKSFQGYFYRKNLRGMDDQIVEIFTDGGCWGNPGPGGWGVLLRYQRVEKQLSGYEAYTTNNRMEMTAAIQALLALKKPSKVHLTTDSTYLKDGITKWIKSWKRNGWKTSDRNLVKNIDLWIQLDAMICKHMVTWAWVRGHSGHRENEIVDKLSQDAIKAFFHSINVAIPEKELRLF
jgi:ribonuclease HI